MLADGSQVLVDRGTRRLTAAGGTAVFDLQGNGWRFRRGDRLRLELAQDDEPYLKASTVPSSLTLKGVVLVLPVRMIRPSQAGADAWGESSHEVDLPAGTVFY